MAFDQKTHLARQGDDYMPTLFYQVDDKGGKYLISPDFVKLADAHGIAGQAVRTRSEVDAAVAEARQHPGPYLLNFLVEKEDSVYPMIPAGSSLHEMIRRPGKNPLVETADEQ